MDKIYDESLGSSSCKPQYRIPRFWEREDLDSGYTCLWIILKSGILDRFYFFSCVGIPEEISTPAPLNIASQKVSSVIKMSVKL